MSGLDWMRDGTDWPNRAASRFVEAGGLRWHVQVMGEGPVMLLIHGTGAATHSWRDLLPMLAQRFTVIAPDLPGHGFTAMPAEDTGLSLPGMARGLAALCRALAVAPEVAVGHSAGAAVAMRMAVDGSIAPRLIVSLNGAIVPLQGATSVWFTTFGRLLARTPFLPHLFAWRAGDPAMVAKLMRDTGSALDPAGLRYYGKLARSPGHVGAALGMMASWDLPALVRDLTKLRTAVLIVVGANDRTIPASDGKRLQAMLPQARLVSLPSLGHLAHEESPRAVADLILQAADAAA